MDESLIEETIEGYQAQLVQIRNLISAADDITKLELYDLEKDLMEMIKISEESLLETKKKNLLASLEKSSTETILEQSNNDRLTEVNGCGSSNSQDDTSNENTGFDYVGTKCRVKYTQEWGSFQYHNAMILNCDIDDTLDDCQVKVHLLFLNPVHKSMVPCKYFLNGNCDYEATCKFSHGYVVDMEELEEYEEPDFTQLKKGGHCLAKYEEDGVWYPATVLSVQEEQATVCYDSYQETETLDFHSILPLFALNESDNSSNEDEVNSLDQDISELPYKTINMAGPMADWEQHTKGIGSKLMLKMGYTMGKGLGKNGDGKIDPVEIKLLPPGKSLDYIAELREKGKIKDPIKNRNKKKKLLMKNESKSAFDIINQLSHKSKSNHSLNQPSCSSNSKFSIEDSYKSMKRHLKDKSKGDAKLHRKSTKDKKLNEDMFKVTEKINNLRKRLALQKQALTRNPGDSPVSRRIKQNIEATQKEIDELKKMDSSLQNKLHMKNQSKKLSVF